MTHVTNPPTEDCFGFYGTMRTASASLQAGLGPRGLAVLWSEAMRQVSRALREKEDLPDLLLIDGGAGHVGEAATVLKELGIDVPCLGLAKKKEELFFPHKKSPLRLPSNDPALRMLQYVRDEAHRFAHNYHSLLRKKKLTARK